MSNISNKASAAPATTDLAIESQPSAQSLDKFYTKSDIARQCVEDFEKWTKIDIVTTTADIIEPSAGAGAFLDFLPARTLAYDLFPEDARITTQDFLELDRQQSAIVIGNPPFGRACSLAVKFINHAATFASYIAVIVPRTFEKDSIQNKLDQNFHLLKQRVLPLDSFTLEGKNHPVPCVFQVWERRDDLRPLVDLPTTHPDFEFVSREEADFAFQRVGAYAGKVKSSFDSVAKDSHYFMRANGSAEELMMLLDAVDFSLAKARNSGVPSIAKTELVALYSALKKTAANDPHPPEGAGQNGDSVEHGTQDLSSGAENLAVLRHNMQPKPPLLEQDNLRRAGFLERIDMRPDPVKRAKLIDGDSFDRDGGGVFASPTGRAAASPPLMAGRLDLQHVLALCAAAVATRRAVPPYSPHVCGETLLPRRLSLDPSALTPLSNAAIRLPGTRRHQRICEDRVGWRLSETITGRPRARAGNGRDLKRIPPDTTGMAKTIAHSPDARLYQARRKLIGLGRDPKLSLSQNYNRLEHPPARQVGRYAHARIRKTLGRLKSYTSRVLRAFERQLRGSPLGALGTRFPEVTALTNRLRAQKRCGRFTFPEDLRFTARWFRGGLKTGMRAPPGNLYDALGEAQGEILRDQRLGISFGDRGCRGHGVDKNTLKQAVCQTGDLFGPTHGRRCTDTARYSTSQSAQSLLSPAPSAFDPPGRSSASCFPVTRKAARALSVRPYFSTYSTNAASSAASRSPI